MLPDQVFDRFAEQAGVTLKEGFIEVGIPDDLDAAMPPCFVVDQSDRSGNVFVDRVGGEFHRQVDACKYRRIRMGVRLRAVETYAG